MPMENEMYINVERAKEKARKLMGQIVAVDQNTSIVVGKLDTVDVERMFSTKTPYCKMMINNGVRFRKDQTFGYKLGDVEMVLANKPEMVMDMKELEKRFPKVHMEVSMKTRMGGWW